MRLVSELTKAKATAEQASLALKGASRELEAKDTVLTDLNERLLQERNEHKGTQRKLDQTRRRLERGAAGIARRSTTTRRRRSLLLLAAAARFF